MIRFRLSRRTRGFSLLEALIAMFIFSTVMVSVTTYFVSIARANQNAKRLQQNLEDVRFAMNQVSKVLRTSVVISPISPSPEGTDSSRIRVYDYSQSSCVEYAFSGEELTQRSSARPASSATPDEKAWCAGASLSSAASIVSARDGSRLIGSFRVVSSQDGGNARAGRVVIRAKVTRQDVSSVAQTSVSLRNYKEVYVP
ncbi:MAG: prepilin-type N-terminal cleavage/methylation domain-containing protein [Candidatus Moraniibacteriota bacterium]|nr:MAG: prepilin-type N-terminal cleavage/methylation domain-containing protein [Candidatus Moranbacteria bacterium]